MKYSAYVHKHRKFFGLLFAGLAFVIAAVYLVIIPDEISKSSGVQKLILLYGHSLCWVLLGGASMLWATHKSHRISAYLAYSALASYVVFMVTLFMVKNNVTF